MAHALIFSTYARDNKFETRAAHYITRTPMKRARENSSANTDVVHLLIDTYGATTLPVNDIIADLGAQHINATCASEILMLPTSFTNISQVHRNAVYVRATFATQSAITQKILDVMMARRYCYSDSNMRRYIVPETGRKEQVYTLSFALF